MEKSKFGHIKASGTTNDPNDPENEQQQEPRSRSGCNSKGKHMSAFHEELPITQSHTNGA
jgi:hypothetical protein